MRRLALVGALVFMVACGDSFVTIQTICRGDTTPAVNDTSLVQCSTLDTLARKGG